ncbi:MAG: lipopolysaccharide heptosyltransferase II [Desulfobacterales bacterium]|nr:lipopolysaccharide heptosyltransferase II [Desulfobacterales bacterium]
MPKRILIIRPSSIGDVVMASPLIYSLKELFPQAYLAWLADPGVRDLLENNPYLDKIICWPKQRWKELARNGHLIKLSGRLLELTRQMRQQHFDLALDAQGLLRSRLLAWLSGAPERLGFESREPGNFLMTKIISRGPDSKHMSSEYYHLAQHLGSTSSKFQPKVVLSKTDYLNAGDRLRMDGLNGQYIVICPFTTRRQKQWFNERWAKLAEIIFKRFNLPVIILGGADDISEGPKIQSQTRVKLYDYCGKTTLGESAALINMADALIGIDTGLTHLGSAFERPTIALFGATCPYLSTESPCTTVLYSKHICSPCKRRPTCNDAFACMQDISVDKVLDTFSNLIGNSNKQQCAYFT